MKHEIETLLQAAETHLRFARIQFEQGELEKALDQLAATQDYLPDLEALMIAQIDKKPEALLAKTVKRDDGKYDLLIRYDAVWRRLGIAEDDVDLGRMITVCGYAAKVSSVPYNTNVKRYFAMTRLEGQEAITGEPMEEEAAHV